MFGKRNPLFMNWEFTTLGIDFQSAAEVYSWFCGEAHCYSNLFLFLLISLVKESEKIDVRGHGASHLSHDSLNKHLFQKMMLLFHRNH